MGCGSTDPAAIEIGPKWDVAEDGSASSIPEEQAWGIAKQQVEQHEHWRDKPLVLNHLTHNVSYGARRIDKGGWKVVAHSAIRENRPDGGGGCAYDPGVPAAVIIIDRRGRVVSYSHSLGPLP